MRIRICLVALSAYPLLARIDSKNVIGPSVHAVLLARELIKHDFDITLITYNEGGPPKESIDGIDVIKTYPSNSHLNPFFKALRLWNDMRKAKAHIYYHHSGASGIVPLYCRLMGKKSVWHLASDFYVKKGLKDFKLLDRFGARLDMKLADAIIAQSEFQKFSLKENYNRNSLLIKYHLPITERGLPKKIKPPIILWVGTVAEVKQPELFLRLAVAIPEASFQMIGGISDDQGQYDRIIEDARKIPNLKFLGVVPFNEITRYFDQAAILANTSKFESYPPYAFIQAWMSYTPVVTLNCNPDIEAMMNRYNIGFHSKTFQQLVEDVRMLLHNEQLRRQIGENGRKYVEDNHDITKIVSQHIEVFNQLAKTEGGR